jgi:hypothetical protein
VRVEVCRDEREVGVSGELRADDHASLAHVRQQERMRILEADGREDRIATVARVRAVPH